MVCGVGRPVVKDFIGQTPVVVISDAVELSVRVYGSEGLVFTRREGETLIDSDDRVRG